MKTAKIFINGHSQAVRLPKEFQFNSKEVEIFKKGNNVILREIPKNLTKAYDLLTSFPDDVFVNIRDDSPPQKRDFFDET